MSKTIRVEGRITPKYKGYFVSFWKKVEGNNTPYSIDEVEELLVSTVDGDILLTKDYLVRNKILKSDICKGKLGFRIKQEDVLN